MMTDREIIDFCKNEIESKEYIVFPEEIFNNITLELAKKIISSVGKTVLIYLPEREIRFFEWLKREDKDIWNDLWGNDELETAPYMVAISFLPLLTDKTRGFPICDLVENENYYFSESHLVDVESKIMVESAQKRFLDKAKMTVPQMLALEISISPIDIWRFAYNHKLSIVEAKKAVKNLVDDKVLVHLTDAGHLSHFIEF